MMLSSQLKAGPKWGWGEGLGEVVRLTLAREESEEPMGRLRLILKRHSIESQHVENTEKYFTKATIELEDQTAPQKLLSFKFRVTYTTSPRIIPNQ